MRVLGLGFLDSPALSCLATRLKVTLVTLELLQASGSHPDIVSAPSAVRERRVGPCGRTEDQGHLPELQGSGLRHPISEHRRQHYGGLDERP